MDTRSKAHSAQIQGHRSWWERTLPYGLRRWDLPHTAAVWRVEIKAWASLKWGDIRARHCQQSLVASWKRKNEKLEDENERKMVVTVDEEQKREVWVKQRRKKEWEKVFNVNMTTKEAFQGGNRSSSPDRHPRKKGGGEAEREDFYSRNRVFI